MFLKKSKALLRRKALNGLTLASVQERPVYSNYAWKGGCDSSWSLWLVGQGGWVKHAMWEEGRTSALCSESARARFILNASSDQLMATWNAMWMSSWKPCLGKNDNKVSRGGYCGCQGGAFMVHRCELTTLPPRVGRAIPELQSEDGLVSYKLLKIKPL